MRYKDICKWTKTEAEKLPEEAYFARVYMDKMPEESEVPHFLSEDKRVFTMEQFKVNHARRIKRIWKRTKSFIEINNYFLKFGMQLNYA